MTRMPLLLLAGATLSLAACSGEDSGNTITANDADVLLNDATVVNESANAIDETGTADTGGAKEAVPPAAERTRPAPPVRQKAETPAPVEEPDPHAGHDMNNMTH